MPVGKVRFYDAEKGFGFLTKDEGGDVYVRSNALPSGVTTLKAGQKVEFGVVEGRKGEQALSLRLLETPPSLSKAHRKPPEQMTVIVEDLIKMLDGVGNALPPWSASRHPYGRQGRHACCGRSPTSWSSEWWPPRLEPARSSPTRSAPRRSTWPARPPSRPPARSGSGEHLGVLAEADRVVHHLFACPHPGYRGWTWSVTLVRAARAKMPTVNEVVLLPGPESLRGRSLDPLGGTDPAR